MFTAKEIDIRSKSVTGGVFTGRDNDSHFYLHPETKYINCTFNNLKPTIDLNEFVDNAHFYYQNCFFQNSPELEIAFKTYGELI